MALLDACLSQPACHNQIPHQILGLLKSYLLLAGGGLAGGGGLLPVVGGLSGLA
jgi:hypothetical protein